MATSAQLKDLRYVMRYQVQGDTTPAIVRRALEKCNKKSKVPVWPGYTFEPNAVRRGLLGGNKCKGAWEAVISSHTAATVLYTDCLTADGHSAFDWRGLVAVAT